jgi:hypothetical protein
VAVVYVYGHNNQAFWSEGIKQDLDTCGDDKSIDLSYIFRGEHHSVDRG